MKTSYDETVNRFINAQNNLVVQHSDFSLRALHDMAVSGAIDLEPQYQRRDRWRHEKQSALIESFILNVPVPPVYLSEDDFGKYSVIDGKQRITAIRDFLSGSLVLSGLKKFQELEKTRFNDLPDQIQNALSIRPYIRVITLLKQTDPKLKYEVFLRLNTGGEKLLPQEIRNVAFSGEFNKLLFKLSSNSFLWERMKIKSKSAQAYRKMDDVEHVLRFFTLQEKWQSIGSRLSDEMDDFMRNNRHANAAKLKGLEEMFSSAIASCKSIWGAKAFYKPHAGGWRSQFISPLFDAEMVAVTQFTKKQIDKMIENKTAIQNALKSKVQIDGAFSKSITQSTNNPSNVKKRIKTIMEILSDCI